MPNNANSDIENEIAQMRKIIESYLLTSKGISNYRLMPLLAEILVRLNRLEGKEATDLPLSIASSQW